MKEKKRKESVHAEKSSGKENKYKLKEQQLFVHSVGSGTD